MLNFYMPVKVLSGEESVKRNAAALTALGKSCLIVTGKTAARKTGALDDVTSVLNEAQIKWTLFDEIGQNPELSACMRAGKAAQSFGAEFIIGIGGGSALDAAKATAVFAANPDMDEAEFYSAKWAHTPLPIALVGTTSGTGSEVTNVAVLTDSKRRKHSIHVNSMYAALAFGDAKYTASLPQSVTLSTGIDVIAHCTESFFSKKANEISRAFSVRGIRLMLPALTAAARGEALSITQREAMYEASILGGLAISVTGTVFPHNVGYYLTESYGIPHGFACAYFLPELLEHVAGTSLAEQFYDGIGCDEAMLKALVEAVLPDRAIEMTEAEIAAALPRWENNGSVKNTVGDVTAEDIGIMLTKKFVKGTLS